MDKKVFALMVRQAQEASGLAAFVGLDWADKEHALALATPGMDEIEAENLAQTSSAISAWAQGLKKRFPGKKVGILIEKTKGPLIHLLMKFDFLTLYFVHPSCIKQYRKAFIPSNAKSDPADAELILDYFIRHHEKLKPFRPDDEMTREIESLVQMRRLAVNDRTRLNNRLLCLLKSVFPEALEILGKDLYTPLALAFLGKWPTLLKLQKAKEQTIRKFFYAKNCRKAELIEQRLKLIKKAVPLTEDNALIRPALIQIELLTKQLACLEKSIKDFDVCIAKLFKTHADAPLFECLPGAGKALAPRLLTVFGTDRSRFETAQEVQEYTGIAPVTEKSGKQLWVHWRWSCSNFIRQTLVEFADQASRFCPWSKAFYKMKRAAGKGRQAALRALAYKWLRILFRCWKNREPYNEATYLKALAKSGSPLIQKMKLKT